ncbi:MAG: T9SS type A sorting domain-containing protein [Ignavibacteriaceae bacterium]|nr:T9SS type A sorting domain-containing protein [Ignavibacteriaceae bacterium]
MMRFNAFVGIILFCFTFSVLPTTINGRFVALGISGSKYSILLQINTNTGSDDLGGSTIVFGFDTSSITYATTPIRNVDYVFHNFSGGSYSPASITRPSKNRIWVNIDLPFINSNNGTVVSASPQWTDIVTIIFDIVDVNKPLGLSWFLASPFWGIYDADNITILETGVFEGNFGLEVQINNGWNSVSVPGINPDGQGANQWWPGKDPTVNVFKMLGSYIPVTTTIPGEGYWMKHLGNKVYNTGDEWPAGGIQRVPHYPIAARAGWNLIGGYETAAATNSLTTTPPGLITGPIYSYSGQFHTASTLEPGYGYFVKMSGDGQINLPGELINGNPEVINYFNQEWGKIILTDASGSSFVLYLVNDEVDLNLFELPPFPPEGAFDIRFASGRIAENLNYGTQTLLMSGIIYPIKVQVENVGITLQDQSGNKINADLIHGEEITVTNESINKLLILSDKSETPITYSLEQNFPNPFNPTTTIKFAVTKESNVNLSIYNILGELVSTLVNEQLKSGYHQYEFDASNLASGVYLYRIIAGDFVETRKMVLLR